MFRLILRCGGNARILRYFSHCMVIAACGFTAACGQQGSSNNTAKTRGADKDQNDTHTNPANMVVLVADEYSEQIEHEQSIQSPRIQIHLDSNRPTYIADCAHSFFLQLPDGREVSLGLPDACDGKPSIDVQQRAIQPPIPLDGPKGMLEGVNWSITQQAPRRPTPRCEQRELLINAGDQCVGFGDFIDTLKDIGLTKICNSVGLGGGLGDMFYYGFTGEHGASTGNCEESWQSNEFYMTCCTKAPETRFSQYMLLDEIDWRKLDHARTFEEKQLRLGVRYTIEPFTGDVPYADQHVALSEPFIVYYDDFYGRYSHLDERREWCHKLRQSLPAYSQRIHAPAPENANEILKAHYSDLVTWHIWYEENIGEVKWYLPEMWTQFVESTGRSWRDFRESVCVHALKRANPNIYRSEEGTLRGDIDCNDFERALANIEWNKDHMKELECDAWLAAGDPNGSSSIH